MDKLKNSKIKYYEAKKYIPGGVNSPVRAFKDVGGQPVFITRGKKSKIYDIDGNEYIDYCMSWGSLILGHAYKTIISAVKKQIEFGTSYGCPTVLETELAKKIVDAVPAIEKIRFVNSGTEAVMSAIRLARAYTKKNMILKFDGCYHGHSDYLLVNAGSGVNNNITAASTGVPKDFIKNTLSIPFNNIDMLKHTIDQNHNELAAVILEPVPANMGLIIPDAGFLETVVELTAKYNVLLIFDEVITGFRVCYGGVQNLYNIKPDLTCLGKIIGGGFPVGAFGGRQEIMDMLAPDGNVYQAGTLSGNPVAMTAGIETLKKLEELSSYLGLINKTYQLKKRLEGICNITAFNSMFSIFFNDGETVRQYNDIKKCDKDKFHEFHKYMLDNNIYLSPSQLETNFISEAHSLHNIEKLAECIIEFFK